MPHSGLLDRVKANAPSVWREGIRVEAALSGGLDSVVLLHLLRRWRESCRFELSAVHVHHGLQAAADGWAEACAALCREWDIPLRLEKVTVETAGLGVEAAARQARYRAFAASDADVLALAHHADDQVETFMLAALRGGGLRALAAMPRERKLTETLCLWRPLLACSRSELAAYAAAHALPFADDPSNQDESYLRNWLRRSALPDWRERLPQLDRHILAAVAQLQEEAALLDEIERQDAAAVCRNGRLDLALWRSLGSARRRRQLQRLVQTALAENLAKAALTDIERVLLVSDKGSWPLKGGCLLAHRGRAGVWRWEDNWPQDENRQETALHTLFSDGLWQIRPSENGLPADIWQQSGRLRPARRGERLQTAAGSKSVNRLLQEAGVPPVLRADWPVLDIGGECAALTGIAADARFAQTGGWLPCWPPLMRWTKRED